MNFEELRENVEKWAEDKDLLHEENADKQFMKFIEEVFEFKSEMDFVDLKLNYKEPTLDLKLELGDVMVTLIVLSKQLNVDIVECLEMAYDKISKRKGKTVNGLFIKEEDL
ncbi:MazG-like family protein [Finegoldia magna]|uniref:MazG-like family protein n=1 Tax=Finegoldia magna TaxID=1260 RepID=UPI0023A94C9A|nr:MazG-like family protein [Finegoldia magna]MCC2717269.1 MazG-like family protein [Finegoldia magna]